MITTLSVAWAGCDLDNPGVPPPPGTLSFPAVVSVPQAGGAPFVLIGNSNFDVRYNAGTLQSFDIQAMEDARTAECDYSAPRDCRSFWDMAGNEQLGCVNLDGVCTLPVPARFLLDEVQMDSQVDGMSLRSSGGRAYFALRARASVTYVDFAADGELTCIDAPDGLGVVHRCDEGHQVRRGEGLAFPADPVAIASASGERFGLGAGNTAEMIVVAHRNGPVSLFRESDASRAPELIDVEQNVRFDVISARFDAVSGAVWLTSAASVTQRASRDLIQMGVRQTSSGERLVTTGILSLTTPEGLPLVNDGLDQRDVVFDPTGERAWVLTRRPEAVIAIDRTRTLSPVGTAVLARAPTSVGQGPMRMQPARVGARDFLVITCFDFRSVWIIDESGDVASITFGMSGPFELAIDNTRGHAYVTDFRESTVYVLDLNPLVATDPDTAREATIRMRLGRPRPPSLFAR